MDSGEVTKKGSAAMPKYFIASKAAVARHPKKQFAPLAVCALGVEVTVAQGTVSFSEQYVCTLFKTTEIHQK